jgi:hypothetical protein
MTTLTLRYIKGDFVVTGPDIQPAKFKSHREAKDWCPDNRNRGGFVEPSSSKSEGPAEGTEGLSRRFLVAAETPLRCNAEHLSPASAGLFFAATSVPPVPHPSICGSRR